jgi:MFS family permease
MASKILLKSMKTKKFYGWKMLAVLWFLYCLMQGFILYGTPVLNTYMVIDLDFSRSILGTGTAVLCICQAFSGPFAAKAVHSRGVRFTIVFGAFIALIGSALMGLTVHSPLGYIICFGVICGFGLGFAGAFAVQSGTNFWFREKRALAQAITLTGSGIGGFVAGHVFGWIVASDPGAWKWGWFVVVITCLITMIVAFVFVVNRPEDICQIPDGATYDHIEKKKRFSRVYKILGNVPMHEILHDYRIWCIVFALGALRFSYNICVAHATIHLLDNGVSDVIAASAIGSMTLLGIIGRLGAGAIGDKIEPRWLWSLGMLLTFVGFISLWYAKSPLLTYAYAGGVGIGFGLCYVSSTAMIANYYGVDAYTSVMSFGIPVQHTLGALGPLFAGFVFDLTGSYDIAFSVGAVALFLGLVGILVSVVPKRPVDAYGDGEVEMPAECAR